MLAPETPESSPQQLRIQGGGMSTEKSSPHAEVSWCGGDQSPLLRTDGGVSSVEDFVIGSIWTRRKALHRCQVVMGKGTHYNMMQGEQAVVHAAQLLDFVKRRNVLCFNIFSLGCWFLRCRKGLDG